MRTRAALIIGISEYSGNFGDLPESMMNLQELEQVLQDPDSGDYELKTLKNIDHNQIQSDIEIFFKNRDPEDVLLLYFAGYGDLGTQNGSRQTVYLCATNSEKTSQTLVESTAISTDFINHHINLSHAKQVIIILDCCIRDEILDQFNEGLEATALHDLREEGRVLLTSFRTRQTAFDQTEGGSLFTKYLIEGMRGSAHFEGAWITAEQLNDYVEQRFEEEYQDGPQPNFLGSQTGNVIPIVNAPKSNLKFEYRKEVDRIFRELDQDLYLKFDGEIKDPLDLGSLETYRERCNLNAEEAKFIERQVQKPYLRQAKKRQKYANYVETVVQYSLPPTPRALKRLSEIRKNLGLGEYDARRIEMQLGLTEAKSASEHRQETIEPPQTLPQEFPPVEEFEIPDELRFKKLEKYLQAEDWKAADHETYRLMIMKIGKDEGNWFRIHELKNYPCDDLMKIDQLWVKHSQGKFGFSVQMQLWNAHGSPRSYNESWKKFGELVGWRRRGKWLSYKSINPTLHSPKGKFPMGGFTSDCVLWDASYRSWGWTFDEVFYSSLFLYFSSLMTRLSSCTRSDI